MEIKGVAGWWGDNSYCWHGPLGGVGPVSVSPWPDEGPEAGAGGGRLVWATLRFPILDGWEHKNVE